MKAVAERHNKMQVDLQGRTPELILHNVKIEDIPVKSYHTLFCPTYVLDARLQSSGGAGPPKREPRSRIGVYLGHSPFHAGNAALVWNPTPGRVSPQYHVVFDDDFTTVPYMEAGTLPPNWENLIQHSCETATAEDIELADTWLSAVAKEGANEDQLSDPFVIMTDPAKRRKTAAPGGSKDNTTQKGTPTSVSEGDKITTFGVSLQPSPQTQQPARIQQAAGGSLSNNSDQAGALRDIFGSNPTNTPNSHDSAVLAMQMPAKLNPYENGLCRSPRLKDQLEKEEQRKRSASHAQTNGISAATQVAFGLFSMFALATNKRMPKHRVNPDASYTEQVLNRFHEVNELYDGTLNEVHHLMYSTNISTNKSFTFRNAMK